MDEFLSFSAIYKRIYPKRLRQAKDVGDKKFGALEKHAQNLDNIIYDMGQKICKAYSGTARNMQARLFYKNLLRAADELLAQDFFLLSTVAVNLASTAAYDGENVVRVAEVFDKFEEQGHKHLLKLKRKLQIACWKDEATGITANEPQSEAAIANTDYSNFLARFTGVLFQAASRVHADMQDGQDIHQRAIQQLLDTAEYEIEEYQNVVIGFYGLCLAPDGFPGGLTIVEQAHDAVMFKADRILTGGAEPLPLQEAENLMINLMWLSANMTAYFHGAPSLQKRGAFAFHHYWKLLDQINTCRASEELNALARSFNKAPKDENHRQGLSTLHGLIRDLQGGPVRSGHLFMRPGGDAAHKRMIENFKALKADNFAYSN